MVAPWNVAMFFIVFHICVNAPFLEKLCISTFASAYILVVTCLLTIRMELSYFSPFYNLESKFSRLSKEATNLRC